MARLRFVVCAAAVILVLSHRAAEAQSARPIYRVDAAGVGSCYDADLSLMLPGHVFACLEVGSLEVFFPDPPEGVAPRERVVLLGDRLDDFSAGACKYLLSNVLGKDVMLAFDAVMRNAAGALLAYVYLPADGTCVNLKVIRDGNARAAPEALFQFREEFEMNEKLAREAHRGIWAQWPGRSP